MTTKIILLLSVVTSGLTAGLFWAYAYSVMPALRSVPDGVFVTTMNRVNAVIPVSGWFWLCFGGGLVLAVAAVIAVAVGDGRESLPWLIAAAAAFVIAVVVTGAVNIPLNTGLEEVSAASDPAALAAARQRHEVPWIRANVVRAVFHTIAFVSSAVALLVYRGQR